VSHSQLDDIILKLTDEVTVKVLNVLLDHKEIIDEDIVNSLNEGIDYAQEDSETEKETEEEIEEDQTVRIALKEVRKSLYKLNERSLARYRRVRDKETGYFVYYWSPIWERIRDLIVSRRKSTIKKLKQRLDYEQRNLLYVCEEGHTPVTFSDAFELGFICTVCGQELAQKENASTISALQNKVSELEKALKTGLEDIKGIEDRMEKSSH
jgi:transcription initiation factor TFIIE subunit alpha